MSAMNTTKPQASALFARMGSLKIKHKQLFVLRTAPIKTRIARFGAKLLRTSARNVKLKPHSLLNLMNAGQLLIPLQTVKNILMNSLALVARRTISLTTLVDAACKSLLRVTVLL